MRELSTTKTNANWTSKEADSLWFLAKITGIKYSSPPPKKENCTLFYHYLNATSKPKRGKKFISRGFVLSDMFALIRKANVLDIWITGVGLQVTTWKCFIFLKHAQCYRLKFCLQRIETQKHTQAHTHNNTNIGTWGIWGMVWTLIIIDLFC